MDALGAEAAKRRETQHGLIFATIAFSLWGCSAWFYKHLSGTNPFEIVAHRAIWAVPIAAIILIVIGRTGDIKRAFTTPRIVLTLTLTTVLVSANWLVFVIAVMEGWAVEASLGYFINPLVNVLIGFALLGERLNRWQWFAVALAVVGVAVQTWNVGSLPWFALFLAATFAAYGYFRKTVDIGPAQGFLVETLLLLPFALAYVGWLAVQGLHDFRPLDDPLTTILLVLCGPMTAGPLILFSAAARRLTLTTIGLLQYLAPSMIFLTAVFLFNEPMDLGRLTSFLFIWVGLVVFSASSWIADRNRPRE